MQLRSFSANYGGMFVLEFLENLVKNLPAHFCHLMMMFFCEFMTSFAYAHRNIQLTEKRQCTCGILTIQFLICPVNLYPLFLFWKHGSVCDPEKKIRSKIWDIKSRVQKTGSLLFKKRRGRQAASFFAPCFFAPDILDPFFSGLQTD